MNNLTKAGFRRLRRTLLPIMALLLALSCTLTVGMYANASTLNGLFGRGGRTVRPLEQSEDLDADYYVQAYASKPEALEAALALSLQISDEGTVLLKNDGLLPLPAGTVLSPMGLRYCLPYYGGSGSSAIGSDADHTVTPAQGLRTAFSAFNTALEERLFQAAGAAESPADNPNLTAARPLSGEVEENTLYEFSASVYEDLGASCAGTVGVVFLGRQTGEDCDASISPYDDGTPHMLSLTAAERETLSFAKACCAHVVVVLASSSPMETALLEDDPDIDAILWLGGAGSTGYASLGRILSGQVNPSGRLPDLWAADFTRSPTFANQDDGSDRFVYTNAPTTLVTRDSWEENAATPFREYEEGIYLGYRYYETAWDTGYLPDYDNRSSGVLYPFGYGLSYTTFSQEIVAFRDRGEEISLTVRVTNTGTQYSGKEVVQVYFTPPYTDLDQAYAVEKSTAVLIQFAKTGLLAPGEQEDLTLSFAKEDMASYCYTRDNGDGTTGCYLLEEGAYVISIRSNSHDVLDCRTATVQKTVWYDSRNPRQSELDAQAELDGSGQPLSLPASAGQAAVNQFEQLNTYMSDPAVSGAVRLSRADWDGTQPTAPTDADRAASGTVRDWIAASDTTGPAVSPEDGPSYSAPASGADNGLVLADLRGRRYWDPMWTLLLDQLTYDDPEALRLCLFQDAYGTGALSDIGMPESVEHDGPQGLTLADVNGQNWIKDVCGYPAAPVMAAAWNQELMYDLGYMVGQEALLSGINGWYAPGLNIHRSPFGGRASEYFSEDPLLTGVLGARVISGAGDAGLSCAAKHFVLMDTEAHKNPHTCVWLTEQALREIYLRPYEIALKTARKTILYIGEEDGLMTRTMRAGDFLMAGDCAVGPLWSAANPALLTGVVRGEWGFQGAIISDMLLNGSDSQVDRLLQAGCDLLMSTASGTPLNATDFQSPAGQRLLRTAVKNLCYTLVNSNLMQGAAPGSLIESSPAPWEICLAVFNGAVALALAAMAGILVWTAWYARRRL